MLVALGALLAAVAILGDWTGFGWFSGSASIGAIGAVLLAFLLSHLPATTGEEVGDHAPQPPRTAEGDGE